MISLPEIYQNLRYQFRLAASMILHRKPFTQTVFLAGAGRSGTTWIGNIINHKNNYRVYFEPFHAEKVPEFRLFKNRQYLRDETSSPEFIDPMNLLLRGRISNKWINSRNKNPFAKKLLIKDIRANLLLHWIKNHHPHVKFILLLRHPCAVALSRMKLKWGSSVSQFLNQPELLEDHLKPFLPVMKAAEGDLEKCVTAWCVENYVPLRQFQPGEILVCYYENFVLDPEAEVRKLMDFIGEPFPPDLDSILSMSSDTNWNKSVHAGNGEISFNRWKEEISPDEYKKIRDILAVFGMDQFYDDNGYPLSPELNP